MFYWTSMREQGKQKQAWGWNKRENFKLDFHIMQERMYSFIKLPTAEF